MWHFHPYLILELGNLRHIPGKSVEDDALLAHIGRHVGLHVPHHHLLGRHLAVGDALPQSGYFRVVPRIWGFGRRPQQLPQADVSPSGFLRRRGAEGGLVAARAAYDPENWGVTRLGGRPEAGGRRRVDGYDLGLRSRGRNRHGFGSGGLGRQTRSGNSRLQLKLLLQF